HGRRVRVRGHHMHVVSRDAELLRDDLREDRQRALACFNRAREQCRGAVFVDLDHRRAWICRNGKSDRVPHARDAASPLLHDRVPFLFFHPKRSAAWRSVSLTTTLWSFWLVGLSDPSSSTFI